MNPPALTSNHLSDDELISALYLADDQDPHLAVCQLCSHRLQALQQHRLQIEAVALPDPNLSFESMATRRRAIYAFLTQPASLWSHLTAPRWITAAVTAVALSGGLIVYQHSQAGSPVEDHISDAQLAQEVSQISQGPEAPSTQPSQELFE